MLSDRERLARQQSRPLLLELHRALGRLGSTLTMMNTGAHPDDEESGMLALFRYGYGMRVVVACSTRGEGGQNSLGPERGGALGVLRSREMEVAARTLDSDIAWLGFGPADAVHDFGFSKNGVDTLGRWGRERVLERLVRAYRTERPDIVIPTFLDVPGQHGHHRAMTEAAETALALAADPAAFPEHMAEGLAPWTVAKFYLPAWPGGGGTYDDELPPPNSTVAVAAAGPDAATGAAFDDIGEWSRAAHATQGMGEWKATPQRLWPLHLKSGSGAPEADIRDGLPATLGALAAVVTPVAGMALQQAEAGIDAARAAFPDRAAIVAALATAVVALAAADAALDEPGRAAHGHRVARKRRELDAALLLAAGVTATAWLSRSAVPPGGAATLTVHVAGPNAVPVTVTPSAAPGLQLAPAPAAADLTAFTVAVAADAAYSTPFTAGFSSLGGNGLLSVTLVADIAGHAVSVALDLDEPLAIVPAHAAVLDPEALLLPLPATAAPLDTQLRVDGPPAVAELAGDAGLAVARTPTGFALTARPGLAAGRHHLPLRLDGGPAFREAVIAYPHIGEARYFTPAGLDVLALDLALPAGARVGYIGGGADRVGLWLQRMGLDVTVLEPGALDADLAAFTTLVIGIFAFGLRPDLAAARTRLHDWVRAGGHLVTLYHRPSDGWDPDATPPARLVIGSPSLRWRVTDPVAPIEVLEPTHKLLAGPNRIGPADWAGWDKERGLYFASGWDPAYVPLLALHDPGEAPLTGALLSARIGAGRHTHTSLVLHHQLDRLVPGAFRLLANLVQPA